MKKSLLTLALAGVLTVGGTVMAFADENEVATGGYRQNGTTGVESLIDSGVSFEDAKTQNLERNYGRVDAAVERGTITLEEGQEIKDEMKANSDVCTTPGENQGTHEGYGLNQGLGGNGSGKGRGMGNGAGQGQGRGGNGAGLRDDSCLVTE